MMGDEPTDGALTMNTNDPHPGSLANSGEKMVPRIKAVHEFIDPPPW